MGSNDNIDISSKYSIELNSKYSTYTKQGSDNGSNTANTILNIIKEQSINNNKESE